jgi:hypothetical protein
VVAQVSFQPGAGKVTWDGTTTAGDPAPPGVYTVSARYGDGQGASEIAPVKHYARVVEARNGEGGVELTLEGGGVVDAETVAGVRETASVAPPPVVDPQTDDSAVDAAEAEGDPVDETTDGEDAVADAGPEAGVGGETMAEEQQAGAFG